MWGNAKALKGNTYCKGTQKLFPHCGPLGTESITDMAASFVVNEAKMPWWVEIVPLQHRHLGRKHLWSTSMFPEFPSFPMFNVLLTHTDPPNEFKLKLLAVLCRILVNYHLNLGNSGPWQQKKDSNLKLILILKWSVHKSVTICLKMLMFIVKAHLHRHSGAALL